MEAGSLADRGKSKTRTLENHKGCGHPARRESFCPLDKDLPWKSHNRTFAVLELHFSGYGGGLNGSTQHSG